MSLPPPQVSYISSYAAADPRDREYYHDELWDYRETLGDVIDELELEVDDAGVRIGPYFDGVFSSARVTR